MGLPLPPYAQIEGFLPDDERSSLLDWVLGHEHSFAPATIRSGNDQIVSPERRIALTSGNLGPLKVALQERLLLALPDLMSRTGATRPQPATLEIELAAHGDGAHFLPHTDLPIGATRKLRTIDDDRVLSAVLYFHAEPKLFSGGELRLFKLGVDPDEADESGFVELQPLQNSLVVFHSWVRHEVRPVRVPSGRFRDYRFAVNIWFRRKIGAESEAV